MISAYIESALIIAILQIVLYIYSRFSKDNSLVDVLWGFGFVASALAVFLNAADQVFIKQLLIVLIAFWGIRLTIYIGKRKIGSAEDFRYANWRNEWGKHEPWRALLQIYMLQGLLMFVLSLPFTKFLSQVGAGYDLNWLHFTGILVFTLGWLLEALADYQKGKFKKQHPQGLMKTGLWKYSRHPNYFGEIVLWWGLGIFCMASGFWITGLLSAVIVTILLRYVSGVPILEKAKEGNVDYEAYKKDTPLLIPFIGKTE